MDKVIIYNLELTTYELGIVSSALMSERYAIREAMAEASKKHDVQSELIFKKQFNAAGDVLDKVSKILRTKDSIAEIERRKRIAQEDAEDAPYRKHITTGGNDGDEQDHS